MKAENLIKTENLTEDLIESENLLEVRDLSVSFRMYERGLRQKESAAIRNLSLSVKKGEILAVFGSSGAGKSLLAHAILGILPPNAQVVGDLLYCGKRLTPKLQQKLRGKEIALVPQSTTYLDPLMRIGKQVAGAKGNRKSSKAALQKYGLGGFVERLFPFQLSGGMARRVLLATAVVGDAQLIVADEPTPGLSAEMAQTAMQHLRTLADEGRGILLITHDMDLALAYADRIAIFYAGTNVETALAQDFQEGVAALRHPYTKALWAAIPQNGFRAIKGNQPLAEELKQGCPFAPRCTLKTEACAKNPVMSKLRGGEVRCIHAT